MSTKLPKGSNASRITEVLQAFFQQEAKTQKEIQKLVACLYDPQASPTERDSARSALTAMLQLTGGKNKAGPVLTRDERFTPAHHALRARMDQAEAAFAATLARLMAERQLTQAELAQSVGVGQSAISMLLKRRCRPQRRTLGKLAQALGVDVEELWPGFSTGWQSGVL
jgi:DNA-binding XRE family transcriptional regulator